ncbi:MAG: ATP-binding cassette domain-containing protein [Firmicutes bacterium]|nr:ATP-binding cassette domain-containing protein [Bacillota bacterium]
MNRKTGLKIWAVAFWLAVWEILSRVLDREIFLVGPVRVVMRLAELLPSGGFWASVGFSLLRITCGYLLAVILGVALAAAALKHERIRELLAPLLTVMRSVPVASFIILALICLPSKSLSVLISFLIAMPVIYGNAYAGLESADPKLLEMTKVFGARPGNVRRAVYIPALYPYLASACRTAIGMAWKAGAAAEVIGIPSGSIGEKLQQAKIYLETLDLFAWTLVIILLSAATEKVFRLILDRGFGRLARIPEPAGTAARGGRVERAVFAIKAENLSKTYGGSKVIDSFTHVFPAGSVTAIMAPSGAGKTTLLRLIAGLEEPDPEDGEPGASGRKAGGGPGACRQLQGSVSGTDKCRISMVFQEDRLCEELDAVSNVMLARNDMGRAEAEALLAELGLGGDPDKKLSEYSGGMKRRVAIARALAADYGLLLLDEPFKGLDGELKALCAEKILESAAGKTVILVTHDSAEAELMNCGEVISLC